MPRSLLRGALFDYLTPDRVSDHLFSPQGSKTTSAPNNITAYICAIMSIFSTSFYTV
jgi:hypothetical protein